VRHPPGLPAVDPPGRGIGAGGRCRDHRASVRLGWRAGCGRVWRGDRRRWGWRSTWRGRGVRPAGDRRGVSRCILHFPGSAGWSNAASSVKVEAGFINSRHCRGHGPVPGRPGWLEGTPWPRPGGFGRGFPPLTRPVPGAIAQIVVSNSAVARFCEAGGLSLGVAGATVVVAGGGASARGVGCGPAPPGSVVYSIIKIPKATSGLLLSHFPRRRSAVRGSGGRVPGEGGARRVSEHAGGCTLQGRSVPVLRRRARLERGLGRAESGGDICDVPAGRFQ
jgi:hypothetical protein